MSSSEVESLQVFIRLIDSLRRNLIIFSQGSFEHFDEIRKIDKVLISIIRKRLTSINSVLINHLQYLVEIQVNFIVIPRSEFWSTEQILVQLESLKVLKEIVRLCSVSRSLQKFCVKLMAREKSIKHLCSFLEITRHNQAQIEISEIFFYYIHRNPIAKLAFIIDEALPLVVKLFEFSTEKVELRKILIGIIREFCTAYPLELMKENIIDILIQQIDSNYTSRKRKKKGNRESEGYSFLDEFVPNVKKESDSDFYLKTISCECLQALLLNHQFTIQRINIPELAELLLENLTQENDTVGIFTPSLLGSVLPPSRDVVPRNRSKILFIESVVKLLETLFSLPDDRNFLFNFHKIEGWKGFLHLINLYLPLFSSSKKSIALRKRVISLLSLLMRALRIFLMNVHYRMCFEYDLVMDKPSFAVLLKSVFQATQDDSEKNDNNNNQLDTSSMNNKNKKNSRRKKGKKKRKKKKKKNTLPSNDPDLVLFQVELSLVFGLIFSKNPFCRYHVKQELSGFPIWGFTLKRHLIRFLQLAEVEYFADIKVVDALGANLVKEMKKSIMRGNKGLKNLKSMLGDVFVEQEERFMKGQENDDDDDDVEEREGEGGNNNNDDRHPEIKKEKEEEKEFFDDGSRKNTSRGQLHRSRLFMFEEDELVDDDDQEESGDPNMPSPIRPSQAGGIPAGIWPGESLPKTPTRLRTLAGDKLLISGKITHSILTFGIYSCFGSSSSSSSRNNQFGDSSLTLNNTSLDSVETNATTNNTSSLVSETSTTTTTTTPDRTRRRREEAQEYQSEMRKRKREEKRARIRAKKEQKQKQKEYLEDGLYLLKIFSKYYEGGYQQMQHKKRVMFDDEYMTDSPTAINQSRKFWNEKHMKSQRDLFVFRIAFVVKEINYLVRRLRAFKKRMKRYLVTCPTKEKLRRSFLYDMNQNAIPALEQLFKELSNFTKKNGQEGLDKVRKLWVESGLEGQGGSDEDYDDVYDDGTPKKKKSNNQEEEEEEGEGEGEERERPLLVDDEELNKSRNEAVICNRNIIEVLQIISNNFSDEDVNVEDELMKQLKGEVRETVSTGKSVHSFGKQEEEMMMSSYTPKASPKILNKLKEKEMDILDDTESKGLGKVRAQRAEFADLKKDVEKLEMTVKTMISGLESKF